MRVKEYPVLVQAIEDGAAFGVRHAFKHDENPPDDDKMEYIIQSVVQEVLNYICESFDLDERGASDES